MVSNIVGNIEIEDGLMQPHRRFISSHNLTLYFFFGSQFFVSIFRPLKPVRLSKKVIEESAPIIHEVFDGFDRLVAIQPSSPRMGAEYEKEDGCILLFNDIAVITRTLKKKESVFLIFAWSSLFL